MNEGEPDTTQEAVPVSAEQTIASKYDAINEAHILAAKQLKDKELAQAEIDSAILKRSMGSHAMRAAPALASQGKEFNPVKPVETKSTLGKKIAMFGLVVGSLFMSKDAQAQQKGSADKKLDTKEAAAPEYKVNRVHLSPEEVKEYADAFHSLTEQNKDDWNKYIEHLKEIGLSGSPKMNSRAVSESAMQDWIAKNPGTTVSTDMVTKIQKGLIYYEDKLNHAEEDAQKSGVTLAAGKSSKEKTVFMEGLKHTSADGFNGVHTSSYEFPRFTLHKTVERPTIKETVGGINANVGTDIKPQKKVEDKGYANPETFASN